MTTRNRTALPPCWTCYPINSTSEPSGTAPPCCDESCLEKVALRECIFQCGEAQNASCSDDDHATAPREGSTTAHSSSLGLVATTFDQRNLSFPSSQSPKRKREACMTHSRRVRDHYSTTLARIGCICKELVAKHLQPCCKEVSPGGKTTPASTSGEKVCTPCPQQPLIEEICACKSKFPGKKLCPQRGNSEDGRAHESATPAALKRDGYCGGDPRNNYSDTERKRPGPFTSCSDSCRLQDTPQEIAVIETCGDADGTAIGAGRDPAISEAGRCSRNGCSSSTEKCRVLNVLPSEDPETGIDLKQATSNLQHVVLDVQGLTCTGCETKLFRSLQQIPGIYRLQTSLVLSQAEFDLDEEAGSVDEVVKSVEKATGFVCQRLNNEGQEVDVLVDGDVKAFVAQKYPHGVFQMTPIGKQLVRIAYDARVVGARVLLRECFDASLSLAAPRRSSELESGKKHVRNMTWITLLSIILTIPVLVMAWAPLPHRPVVYGSASLALATIVQFVVAGPFYPSALRALLFTRVIEIDLLIVLSTSTAYIFSIILFAYAVAGRPLQIEQFFQTSTLLITLIVIGRLVSAFARQRAVESVSIRSLQEETATLCSTDGLEEERIDVRLFQYGDYFKVQPDSRITTDGVVVSGTTEVDESMVTGESLPVEKSPGSPVIAGSLNGSGVIVVRLTHLPGDNTISTIAAMVDQAKFSKPKAQEIVDIVAGYFVPVILVLTIITFAIWMAVGVAVRHQSSGPAAVNAITYSLSVLIVSCPCAIGLAVPMVIVIAGGVAAKHGVIFKSALTIETARNISHVVFDKTGTLTEGRLLVVEELYLLDDHGIAQSVTLGLTYDNKHPVSAAVATYLKEKGVGVSRLEGTKSITGKGVQGTMSGVEVRGGNTRWLAADERAEVKDLLAKGLTVFGVTMSGNLIAVFGLADSLRAESHFVVTELQNRNIAVSIISGDDAGAVDAVAAKLDIPVGRVRSRCTPGEKQEYLKRLVAGEGKKVIFCGDGTNDAVALAQADIGVHINTGSDVAQTAADVVLVRPYLTGILVLLDLSKAAFHRIFFNFAWAFVYNLFAILLAAGAFVNVRIEPQFAGLGEIVSVLPVILIALQLKFFKRQY